MIYDRERTKASTAQICCGTIKEVDIMRGFIAGIVFTLIVEGAAITVIVGDKIKEVLSDEENG